MDSLMFKYESIQKEIEKTNTLLSTCEKEFEGNKKLFCSMTIDELKYNFSEYHNKLKTLFDNMNNYEREINNKTNELNTLAKQIQEEQKKGSDNGQEKKTRTRFNFKKKA